MSSFATIVPCFNEAQRIPVTAFVEFAATHHDVTFVFVNDGSTDGTGEVLQTIRQQAPACQVLHLPANRGKGEAVRQAILSIMHQQFSYIGYLDADLSTSLQEFYNLYQFARSNHADAVLGSRIKKIDTEIRRSALRHFAGRAIATLIDSRFNLGVYDTQCGAKVFKTELLDQYIHQPFRTKWFFDVELLLRIRQGTPQARLYEVPLKKWTNMKKSKLSIASFPDVAKELWTLANHY